MDSRFVVLFGLLVLLVCSPSTAQPANGFPSIDTSNLPYGISEDDWKNKPTYELARDFKVTLEAEGLSIAGECRPQLFSGFSNISLGQRMNYTWPNYTATDVLCLAYYANLYEYLFDQGQTEPLNFVETGGLEISGDDIREVAMKLQQSFDVRAQYELGRMLLTGAYDLREDSIYKDHSFRIGISLRQAEKLGSELAGSANAAFTANQNAEKEQRQEAERQAKIARGEPASMSEATMVQAERFCRADDLDACARMIELGIDGETSAYLPTGRSKLGAVCTKPGPAEDMCGPYARALEAGIGGSKDIDGAIRAYQESCEQGKAFFDSLANYQKQFGNELEFKKEPADCEKAKQLRRDRNTERIESARRATAAQEARNAAQRRSEEQSRLAAAEALCAGFSVTKCYDLGVEYAEGNGRTRNYAEAARLFTFTCDKEEGVGCNYLGYLYERGQGVSRSYTSAARFYKLACDNGDEVGCSNLGVLYEYGTGVSRNYSEAARLHKLACDKGDAKGCASLGWLYDEGKGVSRNYSEAARLYKLACDKGNANGCGNLGWLNESGRGMPQRYTEAARLYRKSCDGGEGHFCNNLGLMYANGRGVTRSYPEAARLFRLACDKGEQEGCNNLYVLNSSPSTQQPCIPIVDPGVPGSRRCQ